MCRALARCAVLVAAFLMLSLPALAQAPDYTVYVSDTTGGRILAFHADGTAWPEKDLPPNPHASNFRPSDMVVGPDGMLYICEPSASRIWRYSSLLGEGYELIYASSFGGDPISPNAPEAPLFGPDAGPGAQIQAHDSLYFSTKGGGPNDHTGTFRISAVAMIPFGHDFSTGVWGGISTLPHQILTEGDTGSQNTEGMTWGIDGRLLIADRAGQRVLVADEDPGDPDNRYAIASTIDGVGDVVGLAVSSYGDVFVGVQGGSGPAIARYPMVPKCDEGNLLNCYVDYQLTPSGAFTDFGSGSEPYYMEIDADNVLWVAAATTRGQGSGELYRIQLDYADGFAFGTPQTSPRVQRSEYVGVALPVTTASRTAAFGTGTYDFGNTNVSFQLSEACGTGEVLELEVEQWNPEVLNGFLRNSPLITGDPLKYPPENVSCVRYAGLGGRCVRYVLTTPSSCGEYEMLVKFFSDGINLPGLLHAPGTSHDYFEDMLIQYLPNAEPGDLAGDPGMRGGTSGGGSAWVAIDGGANPRVPYAAISGTNEYEITDPYASTVRVLLDGTNSAGFEGERAGLSCLWEWTDEGGASGNAAGDCFFVDEGGHILDQLGKSYSADNAEFDEQLGFGVWTVDLAVADSTGTSTASRTVTVADNAPPLLSLTDGPGPGTLDGTILSVAVEGVTATVELSYEIDSTGTEDRQSGVESEVWLLKDTGGTTVVSSVTVEQGQEVEVWYRATDHAGNYAEEKITVKGLDLTPPEFTGGTTIGNSRSYDIKQVNHKLVRLSLDPIKVTDPSTPVQCKVAWIAHSEEINSTGDGDTDLEGVDWVNLTPNYTAVDSLSVKLIAERAGTGSHTREYAVGVQCVDAVGNETVIRPRPEQGGVWPHNELESLWGVVLVTIRGPY